MITLLNQYKYNRAGLKKMIRNLGECEKDVEDKAIINSMVRDMSFIIDWIEKGSNPEELRGINIKSAYHIKYLPSMEILPDITEELTKEREPLKLTNEQRHIIFKLFNEWTDRERDCFILHVSDNKSMSEVAEVLNISKASVQVYIKRAKQKIKLVKEKQKQLVLL